MSDPIAIEPSPPTTIENDLPCAICGYNLKGLATDGTCPECGQGVDRTYTQELIKSDPVWLRTQASAMLLLAGLALSALHPGDRAYQGRYVVWMILSAMAAFTGVWGCWRLATPEPPGPPASTEGTLQRAVRLVPLVYALLLVGSLARVAFVVQFWAYAGLAGMISLVVTCWMAGWFVHRLARRSGEPSLILHARIALWAFPLSQALAPIALLTFMMRSRDAAAPGEWFYTVLGVANYLLGAAVYFTLLLLGRMHEALRSAARVAEAAR